ncbi:ABC1 kinase family protein [Acinetobacter radioresistens]|jgi:predicted unusual protein kinase regulating ubiquinone biosynthesis (AarF/ABC1/UbiB family)|uniref:AarF/ABC1/UbiB kinase family protein n=1 Tax=Acinetobacter radioresistens TaxID=40216 RepID=A0A8H2K136_ACIRA|nr:AarF/ABC1/UbiB kinase family protein [Acinetobacter radioresistens]EJO36125.1 ABC1 family protein [Acinetobacter radioresistens WC-A-157]MCK4086435.1 AarF/ABC1/UbiB kinase family protein [Acinetobacter radioresistens]MCK4089314.1 AarF/ABC1/UbiB kinase family protein [Acinetobacter radioresistens]MCK4102551.1 AarF/ABC1/UbiB kinase family protein [Acinetobacter radioresistens]MCU4596926.1 AarF/ABC1/UbiB kinase family protein [Acinetobacter radioresistens]
MAKNASSPGRRFMKLAGMTASIATRSVSNSIRNIRADEEQKQAARSQLFQDIGVQIANTLGEMKGAVMKVGQIASQYKDIFPPEVAKAISKLQRQAPPMPFPAIQKQLEKELGQPIDNLFTSFDREPFAAASIGQVHKAILPNGEQVVVKVQYPGVDEACESDLKQVRLALRLMGVLKIDKKLQDRLFAEIQDSLNAELNYEIEAQNLTVFKTFHEALDEKIIIPRVYPQYSTRRVLTLSLEQGESIETASTWPQDVRNQLGRRLVRALGQEIFYLKRFHCDPHPGNFAFREDGHVIVYDYGGVKTLNTEIIEHFKTLINAARQHDIDMLEDQLITLNALSEKGKFPKELYEEWLDVLLRPLTTQYDFAENSAHHDGVLLVKKSLKYWDLFKPSPDTLMVNRTISGHYWNLIQLKVNDDLSDLFEELVASDQQDKL